MESLPNEIVIQILLFSEIEEIGRFSQINKRFNEIAKDEHIWKDKIKKDYEIVLSSFQNLTLLTWKERYKFIHGRERVIAIYHFNKYKGIFRYMDYPDLNINSFITKMTEYMKNNYSECISNLAIATDKQNQIMAVSFIYDKYILTAFKNNFPYQVRKIYNIDIENLNDLLDIFLSILLGYIPDKDIRESINNTAKEIYDDSFWKEVQEILALTLEIK